MAYNGNYQTRQNQNCCDVNIGGSIPGSGMFLLTWQTWESFGRARSYDTLLLGLVWDLYTEGFLSRLLKKL